MRRGRYYAQPPFPFVPGYDVVGTVIAIGDGVDAALMGGRYAAVTKVGAWAEFVDVDARALMPVPLDLDAAAVESIIVNGITAWRMLHEVARVRPGGTVLVLGANGGVGSTLVQLAGAAGIRVVGTAAPRHHGLLRELGAEPVDYRDPALRERVRSLSPGGYDAVFDHVGGAGIGDSWALVRRGGALVSYGTAAAKDEDRSIGRVFFTLFARLTLWNLLPNGRRASFFDFWRGVRRPAAFSARTGAAFARVLELLESGALRPQIAARFPLTDAAAALQLAESRTVAGKVILLPA
jgi:NADPH:quinone reductase-like Zn-dependent oxidoreductase